MGPTKIMIIRHAEKPIPGKVQGVRARGEMDDASLTPVGWQRAGALIGFFDKPGSPHVAPPDHLVATRRDSSGVNSSRREKQTLRPLSLARGMAIDDRFGKEQEARLALALRPLAGTVLIAWAHENIPKLVAAIEPRVRAPQSWPDDRFDLVWVLERTPRQPAKFLQIPQRLLSGDSDTPIPLP